MNDSQLRRELEKLLPKEQLFTDELSRLVKGCDAGLYRLIPRAVVKVNSEAEVIRLMQFCSRENIPVTFKAAGTSLSGQTITDSILMESGEDLLFGHHRQRKTATFGVSLTGTAPTGCCSVTTGRSGRNRHRSMRRRLAVSWQTTPRIELRIQHNSYNTVRSMRIIFADGTLLDTADPASRQAFAESHPELIASLVELHREVTGNEAIRNRIAEKFRLKNTCGYGVNALIDFSDPIEILQHLMIGSEGTLGFISQATFETVPDHRLKATALVYFRNLRDVCQAILPLRGSPVSAAELMDRNALRAVENQTGVPAELKSLPEEAAALLIDTSADDEETLLAQIGEIESAMNHIHTLSAIRFTTDRQLYNLYWVFATVVTSAAASRPPQTAWCHRGYCLRRGNPGRCACRGT